MPAAQEFPAALGGDGIAWAPRGLNDAKGFVFISDVGEVYPSGFFPQSAGSIRREPLGEIYRNSPLFRRLRDTSQLKGKCGRCEFCEFKEICGGSRARAYALTGDVMAEESCCVYQPKRAAQQSHVASTTAYPRLESKHLQVVAANPDHQPATRQAKSNLQV